MAENEDIPYSAPEFATPEAEKKTDDPDQLNKSVLIDTLEYLDEQIKKHNTFDIIEPAAEGVMTTQQQVQMHKQVVLHLRNIRITIRDKVKELR